MLLRIISVFLVLSILLSSFAVFSILGEETIEKECRIDIEMEETELWADVEPGDSGEVKFYGLLEVYFPTHSTIDQVRINLTYDAGDWVVLGIISFVLSRNNPSRKICATVHVPKSTFAGASETLTITAKADNMSNDQSYDMKTTTGKVYVNRYHKLNVEYDNQIETIRGGGYVDYELQITNLGNDMETVKLLVDNAEYLDKTDIEVDFSQQEYIIEEGCSAKSQVTIKTGDSTPTGRHTAVIKVFTYRAISDNLPPDEVYMNITIDVEEEKIIPVPGAVGIVFSSLVLISLGASMFGRRRRTIGS